jgi:hypothetical protein
VAVVVLSAELMTSSLLWWVALMLGAGRLRIDGFKGASGRPRRTDTVGTSAE